MSSGIDRTTEEIQKEIDKIQAEIEHLKKYVEELTIAKNAKTLGINMSAPLPSGKDYEDFEQELRDRAAAEEDEEERAHFEHLGKALKKGGKNKRKSHKQKSHKRKSHKHKSYKRSKY
jgi:hypothetical protein